MAGLALVGCGDDDSPKAVPVDERGRYCDLARQFEETAVGSGASSAPGVFDGAPETIIALLEQTEGFVTEMQDSAPEEAEDSVRAVITGLTNARDGAPDALTSPDFSAANQEIAAYRTTSCPTGTETGGDL